MMFEMELYKGISSKYKFGRRWLMIPFTNCSFCFLFEDDDDWLFCRTRVAPVCDPYVLD